MNFQADQILKQLVLEFLEEPFAQRQRFHEKDLSTVCQEIESTFHSLEANTASYEKSRDLLCLILCQLELLGCSEMPAINLGDLNPSDKPSPISSSPFLTAANLLRGLKGSQEILPDNRHLDRLIGLHLCLELESRANKILKPPFFLSLNDLGLWVHEAGLNSALAELLICLDTKKNDSTRLGLEISDSWLRELERDFEAAVEYLNESFELKNEQGKAA